MRKFLTVLLAFFLFVSLFFAGLSFTFKRTFLNPVLYSNALDTIDLSRAPEVFAKLKKEETEKKHTQKDEDLEDGVAETGNATEQRITLEILPYVLKTLGPQIKAQTKKNIASTFEYFQGDKEKLDIVYDLTALKNDIPIPKKFDVLKIAKVSPEDLEDVRSKIVPEYKKFKRLYISSIVIVLLVVVTLMLLLRTLRKFLLVVGISSFLAGVFLFIPYGLLDGLFKSLGGNIFGFLSGIGYTQNVISAIKSSFLILPLTISIAGVVFLVLSRFITHKAG